jgi:hypothetical protein
VGAVLGLEGIRKGRRQVSRMVGPFEQGKGGEELGRHLDHCLPGVLILLVQTVGLILLDELEEVRLAKKAR